MKVSLWPLCLCGFLWIQQEPDFFKKWLDGDVVYIITKEESEAAKLLKTPEEKDAFIQQFWERRDPTPGTLLNEFREEHYRRIAYANEVYTAGTIGWRTDRGKMYIRFGAPDGIERSPSAGSSVMRSGAIRMTVPFEIWEYRNIPEIGHVKMTFVDRTMTGYYELTANPEDKIAKFSNEDPAMYKDSLDHATTLGETPESQIFANRIRQYIAIQRPPEIRFKDLREIINVRLTYNLLPYDLRFDVIRGVGDKSIVPITFQFDPSTVTFNETPDGRRGLLNVYGAVTNVAGRMVSEFEDAVTLFGTPYYQRFVALEPGRYKLMTVVRDVHGGNVGTKEQLITIPRSQNKLTTSSLILADLLVPAAPTEPPLDNFVISRYKVRPLVRSEISRKTRLGLYLEVYNFGTDPNSHLPDLEADLQIFEKGRSSALITLPITLDEMNTRYNDRLLIVKTLDTSNFANGEYVLRLRVTDKLKDEIVVAEGSFLLKD